MGKGDNNTPLDSCWLTRTSLKLLNTDLGCNSLALIPSRMSVSLKRLRVWVLDDAFVRVRASP